MITYGDIVRIYDSGNTVTFYGGQKFEVLSHARCDGSSDCDKTAVGQQCAGVVEVRAVNDPGQWAIQHINADGSLEVTS